MFIISFLSLLSRHWVRYSFGVALLCAVYVAAGKAGLMLAFLHPSASPVWPPTGIAIAALFLFGLRSWPAILLGAFLVNVTTEGTVFTSVVIAVGNTVEALLGATFLRRLAGGEHAFERVENVVLYALSVVMLSTTVSATVGILALLLSGFVSQADAGTAWFTWWLGDALGALTIAPLLILWRRDVQRVPWNTRKILEAVALSASVIVIGTAVFASSLFAGTAGNPLAYLAFLPILWAAIRFGPREAVTTVCVLSCIAVVGTVRGSGPFVVASANTSLLLLQAFMATASVTGILLAAALRERRMFERSLERTIDARTRELASALDRESANLQRLQDMVEHMTVAAAATDEDLRILHANERFRQIFGGSRSGDNLQGVHVSAVFRDADALFLPADSPSAMLDRFLTAGKRVIRQEVRMKNGTTLSCDYIPIDHHSVRRGHLLLLRDVTLEKRADRAKTEFVALASHQLRTPLTKIRWAAGRLLRQHLAPEHASLAQIMKSASRVMADTIDVMLLISRIEAGKIDPSCTTVDLSLLLQELCAERLAETAARAQHVHVQSAEGLILFTDAQLLREMLRTLLSNAVKYTLPSGTITVRAEQEAGGIRLQVTDTGIGIPVEQQQSVFQKFFRADNAALHDQSGIGLGLYLVRMIAALLGAHVSFSSHLGRGTTFSLFSPSVAPERNAANSSPIAHISVQ